MITYLSDLNKSIIIQDLILRFNIKNEELFRRIVNYVLMSNFRIFSSRSIEKYLKNEHIKGSINTIIKYLNYLEKLMLLIELLLTKQKLKVNYYTILKYIMKTFLLTLYVV